MERYERDLERAAAGGDVAQLALQKQLPAIICRQENLYRAAQHLRRYGGDAPGPDGIRLAEISDADLWKLLRSYSEQLLSGSYCPGDALRTKVPKYSGGTRTIELFNVGDRIVSRAALQILSPWFEPSFCTSSFGFRPRLSAQHALAAALTQAERENHFIWLTCDVQNAFGCVPVSRLLELIRGSCGQATALLIGSILGNRPRGVAQGAALSALLLNVYLDKFLDRPWQKSDRAPMFRYADDLLFVCGDVVEANECARQLDELLRPTGMQIKDDDSKAVVDVNVAPAQWLGYQIARQGGQWALCIRDTAWDDLRIDLEHCQHNPNALRRSRVTVRGWLDYMGPCFDPGDVDAASNRIRGIVQQCGFAEPPSRKTIREWWRRAWRRWQTIRSNLGE